VLTTVTKPAGKGGGGGVIRHACVSLPTPLLEHFGMPFVKLLRYILREEPTIVNCAHVSLTLYAWNEFWTQIHSM